MRVNHESLLTLKMIASKRERLNRVYKGPDFPDEVKKKFRSPCNCGVSGRAESNHAKLYICRCSCIVEVKDVQKHKKKS